MLQHELELGIESTTHNAELAYRVIIQTFFQSQPNVK